MDFDREAARRAGYTEEEIDAYLRQQNQPATQAAPAAPTTTNFDREAARKAGYTDEEIDAYLSGAPAAATSQGAPGSIYGLAAPAVTAYGYSQPTGLKPLAQGAGQLAGQGLKAMAARPLWTNIGDIAGVASHGVPYGSIARSAVQAATANPAQAADVLAKGMEIARQAPGIARQLGTGLVRGAARVAGPVGLAANLYEAAPYLSQVGPALATGQPQQNMRDARRSMLNAPTPAPLTRQEAENLMASGDQRMIEIYKNDAELANLIRRKAAERVMGPVAPGQF